MTLVSEPPSVALISDIHSRELYMKGIDYSFTSLLTLSVHICKGMIVAVGRIIVQMNMFEQGIDG